MAQLKLDTNSARQFLLALYSRIYSQKQKITYIEVRGKREGESMTFRKFYPNLEALLKDMPRWKPGLNYWVGVALRRDTKGGKKENLWALTAAFCDVDCGPAGHKNAPRYQTKPEALALTNRASIFGFAPGLRLLPEPTAMGDIYIPAGCGRNAWGFICFAPIFFYGSSPDLNLGAKSTAMKSTKMAEKNGHPVPKPIEWMKWLVNLGSRPTETILDPFLGSGTTAVAAKELGRKFIGIEISEEYCAIAVKRLRQNVLNFG